LEDPSLTSQTSFASFLAGGQIIADRDDAVPKVLNPHLLLPEFLVGENSLQYFDESQEVSSLNIRRSASTIDGPNQITF